MDTKANQISAQVVLSSESKKDVGQVTASNVDQTKPSSDRYQRVTNVFTKAGFQTGNLVGTSFSITASKDTFERFFDVHITSNQKSAVLKFQKKEKTSFELSREHLPKSIATDVDVITFTPPPDFGPGNF